MKRITALTIATWFGCGYAPIAPGTAGSLAAVGLAWLLFRLAPWPVWSLAILVALGTAPAIWAADTAAKVVNKKDPGLVVVDEVLGQWLTLAAAPRLNWRSYLGAFVLFRVFDIVKPPPVRQLEALPGGVGIVADDLMAGVYGAVVLFVAGCFNLY